MKQIIETGDFSWRLHYARKLSKRLTIVAGLDGSVARGSAKVPGLGGGENDQGEGTERKD